MKLLFAVVISTALLAAVHGKSYEYQCIKLNVTGTVTMTATNTKTKVPENPVVIDLSTVTSNITGNCSKENTSVVMVVVLNKVASWVLTFKNVNEKVSLDQMVSFKPADLFNGTATGSVTLSSKQALALSSSKASYECKSVQIISFTPKEEGNYSFGVSQNITFMQVQAFGLPQNKSFSPAEECSADQTTTPVPTTEATTAPAPTPGPVPKTKPQTFVVKDTKDVACFRLVAGLQFTVEYEKSNKTMALSKVQTIPGTANVTGTCASGSANTATMTIKEGDYSLVIKETRAKKMASSTITLTVNKLDPAFFPGAVNANKTLSFELTTFKQSSADTFFRCDSQQQLTFASSTTTLFANDVKLQAFNLNNGSFSGEGVRCGLDPTPQPMPPAVVAGDNTYTVKNTYGNVTCIVLTGEISFSNVTYTKKEGTAESQPIVIPAMNETSQNVNGTCDLEGGKAQRLVITFNGNWTLALTFAVGSSSAMLGSTPEQYSVRDIVLTYYLIPEFFPNTTDQGAQRSASQMNITTGFMKGNSQGGSYKCDASQTETLSDGVLFQTAKLQYKAFNGDNKTAFNNDVMECSADDESNSIVPIAVGAALAGLVAIVLIAYLIGRRRSRRQGYESV